MSVSTHYTARQKRALNQIWSSAGEYGFEPLFMALRGGGEPDLYMNCIAGSLRRWYGPEMPRTLFGAWAGDRRQELLDGLCWLALESAVYRRELPERPVLAELRRSHALDFFDQEQTLSRQEWMAKNQLLYAMQSARWRAALGRQSPILTPYEKKLSHALDCGALDGETLARTVLDIFQRFRLFHGTLETPSALRLHLDGILAALALKLRPSEIRHTDMISVSTGRIGAGAAAPDLRRGRLRLNGNAETDRDYIESCFGPPLLPQRELELLEQKLCTEAHFGCRLWLSSGVPDAARAKRRETRYLIQQSDLQCRRNRDAYARDSALYQSMIAQLTGRIRDCLQTYSQNDRAPARGGRLNASRAWRGAVLGEDRLFDRETASLRPGFSVELLLDASSSRLHCQEAVAAQGYILSESLSRCGVPVRVSGFCSVRGYTVLRVFKDFADKQGSRKIFRYFASGWNRDGLVLRAAGALPGNAPGERRFLLLLTDAAPSDSRRIPSGGKYPLGHDYDGAPAVEDTAREVRALRRQGLRVAAVFMGAGISVPAAKTIYGPGLARIQSMDQLAAAAGALIQNEIRELSD